MSTLNPRRFAAAVVLFIAAGVSQYIGAALATGLFGQMGSLTVGWWRIALSAVVLLLWRRPWRKGAPWWRWAVLFGLALTGMNLAFYLAIERIHLGTAVAIEFVGPVAVAALAGRGLGQRLAGFFAAAGVVTISGFGVDWSEPGTGWGLFWAAVAGALWGLYVVLGDRLASRVSGMDALSIGMASGALIFSPLAFGTPAATFGMADVLLILGAVAFLSSVIPYVVDQLNFGVLTAATFAILQALLPATSVVVGAVMLAQVPTVAQLLGLALISIAVLLANAPDRRHRVTAPPSSSSSSSSPLPPPPPSSSSSAPASSASHSSGSSAPPSSGSSVPPSSGSSAESVD